MTDYSKFPQYQSLINNAYAGTESQILSELNDYQNPTLTSTEMQFNENDMIVKPAIYSEPKYIKKKEVHETLKPISNEVKILPTKTKQKVKTLDTFYNKTIILSENDDVNQILQNNQMFEQQINPPLPTQSTIANLCKDSVLIPSSSNYNPPQQQTNNFQIQSDYNNLFNEQQMYDTKVIAKVINDNQKSYNNQPLASKVSKISNTSKNQSKVYNPAQISNTQNMKYQSTNINNNYNISKVSNFPSTYTNFGKEYSGTKITKISGNHGNLDINNFNQNQMPLNVPNINKDYHQSKIQMSKIPYMKAQSKLNNLSNDGGFEEVTDLSKKSNKNFVQEYFHDDDIPKPIVYEGSGLDNSEIKPNINNTNNFEPSNQEQKIIEQSIKNSKNGQPSIQKNSYVNQTNIINNNINNKSMNQSNINNNYNKSIEQNNINNKSIKKFSSKEAQQTNSLLAQIPVDQSEIMSHQPSINMSQKESIIFKKSVHQSTVDPNLVQDSKIERQSKAYQQQSNIPSNLQKSNANSKKGNSSQALAHTQKSNMTFQQPYNQYNQSQNSQNPQIYYSQDIQNNQYNNNQKSIKVPSNMKVSGQQSKINQINDSIPISQNINNQSNIYQNSVKHSGVNNIGNDNIIASNQIIQSNNSKINQYVISQHQSKIGQSNDLISSSNGDKKRESEIYEPTPNKSNTSKNNNSYNKVKGDRSSFPTQSYAGNFNSKETIPPNPFGEQSNSLKGSNLKMLEDKLKDSEIK